MPRGPRPVARHRGGNEHAALRIRRLRGIATLAVIERDLEQPRQLRDIGFDEARRLVAVADAREIAIGRARQVAAVAFAGHRQVDRRRVFGNVVVDDAVALVVAALADQPTEDAGRILGVRDAALRGLAIEGRDVVPGDRAPVGVAVADSRPALDAREQAFDARPVARHTVAAARGAVAYPVARRAFDRRGHQVLAAREDEHVRLFPVFVTRQALVGAAGDRRQREGPAQAERAIAGAGVVGQRERRSEPGAARAGGNRQRQGAGAAHRIGGELFTDAADRASPLGQSNRCTQSPIGDGRRGCRAAVLLRPG